MGMMFIGSTDITSSSIYTHEGLGNSVPCQLLTKFHEKLSAPILSSLSYLQDCHPWSWNRNGHRISRLGVGRIM